MDYFAERFKLLKTASGMTYPQIAGFLGVTPRNVKSYAAGTSKPDYYKLIAIADLFEVSLDYLTGRTDSPNSHKE